MRVTYFIEVFSSWCHWAEPAWSEVKARYAGQVEFDWQISSMRPEQFPADRRQCDWFYRRSGTLMRSPYMLNSGWLVPGSDWGVPNRVAEAARQLGATDDRVRLALAHAAVREGREICRLEIATEVAAAASGLSAKTLAERADQLDIAAIIATSTARFHALGMTQRPAFLVENAIGDRAIFSGLASAAPALCAAIDSLLADERAYAAYAAHHGKSPDAALP